MSQLLAERPRDCRACRLVGGGGLVGLGVYVGYHGRRRGGWHGTLIMMLAAVTAGLGVVRVMGLHPMPRGGSAQHQE